MNFDALRTDLLILFDSEEILDKEARIVRYKYTFNEDFIFTLYISGIEDVVTISLSHKKLDLFIFDVLLEDITKIICKENKLFFYKKSNIEEPSAIVQVKPSVSLSCDL